MITSQLKGGLGNQLFEVATGISYAEDSLQDYVFCHDSVHSWKSSGGESPSTYSNTIYKNIKRVNTRFDNNYSEPRFTYDPIPERLSDCMLRGYFQSEKYFKHNREKIIETLNFDHLDIDTDSLKDCCSIHVRRGDYIRLKHIYNNLDYGYYKQAMGVVDCDRYIIFSDDLSWCRYTFIGDQFIFSDEQDITSIIYTMSNCSDNIIANSSLSWWGAWLNSSVSKKTVAPKIWFSDTSRCSNDIIPEQWIQI